MIGRGVRTVPGWRTGFWVMDDNACPTLLPPTTATASGLAASPALPDPPLLRLPEGSAAVRLPAAPSPVDIDVGSDDGPEHQPLGDDSLADDPADRFAAVPGRSTAPTARPAAGIDPPVGGPVAHDRSFGPSTAAGPYDDVARLTAAMAAGDPAAVAAFYERYFPRLLGWARRFTRRDESFCLDVVQDVVLRIVRTVRRVDAEPQLLAWLRLVVQATAYDLLKAERRRDQRERNAPPAATAHFHTSAVGGRSPVPAAAPVGDPVVEAEQLAWLRAELDALDPRLAEMIDLRFRGGWTLARIGALFGLSAGTVDGRLRRTLAVLRTRAKSAFDPDLLDPAAARRDGTDPATERNAGGSSNAVRRSTDRSSEPIAPGGSPG